MNGEEGENDLQALRQETKSIWNDNAAFWDEKMGEGNLFQRVLVGPATERLLELKEGETILDVACGNGVFARRLAALGAKVVACDFSEVFLERAQARTVEHAERIDYRLVDATDEAALLELGRKRFDAAVCNMALMDMPTIKPLLRALKELLKPRGRFIFSVSHPCFNSTGCRMTVEREDRGGELVTTYAIKVVSYANLKPEKGLGIIGQPRPHYYFDRSISEIFNACFREGFVLDGIEEPTLGAEEESEKLLSWVNYKEIPPVLVARMRLLP